MGSKEYFGENLKALRRERGIGQSELAEILRISPKTISHWETGYTEPSISQLIALANFFELPIDELVGRIL